MLVRSRLSSEDYHTLYWILQTLQLFSTFSDHVKYGLVFVGYVHFGELTELGTELNREPMTISDHSIADC